MTARYELIGAVDVAICVLIEFPLQSLTLARRSLCEFNPNLQQERPPLAPENGFAQYR